MKMKNKTITPLNEAQRELVTQNIGLAMNIGRRFAGLGRFKGIAMEDLQQEACYGLCVAAGRYKAVAPGNVADSVGGVRGTAAPGGAAGGTGGSSAGFSTYAYDWCYKYVMMAINGTAENGNDDLETVEAEDEDDYSRSLLELIDRMMDRLNPKEREVICLIYGLTYRQGVSETGARDFSEVATMLHIKVLRVRQIYQGAMKKLRDFSGCEGE